MMRSGALGQAVRLFVIAAVLVALFLFGRGVDWRETWLAVREASPWLLVLAALVNLLSLALKAARWWVFLSAAGIPSLRLALRATFAGAALNNILVANAGEAARVLLVARASGTSSERVLATVALERLFEFAGYVAMLAAAVSLLRLPPSLHQLRPFAFGGVALLVGLFAYLARHPERMQSRPLVLSGLVARIAEYGRGFLRTLRELSTPSRFASAMSISVAVWSLQIATYHLTARAAHFDMPVVGTISAILAVNLGFAIRATPGNVGLFQAMYALTASAFGMDADAAVGVGLLIQAQQILPVTLIGLLSGGGYSLSARSTAPMSTRAPRAMSSSVENSRGE